jgi:hypothetical protein
VTVSQTSDRPTQAPLSQPLDARIAFRARIGVTGHRHIEDCEAIAPAIADQLDHVRALFRPTEATPVVFSVLSALAEGADRLVVRVALESHPALDVELGAVLPLALTDYLEDFDTDTSRQEFRDLLAQAATLVELRREPVPVGHVRDSAYDLAGRYIVDRSDVLIAVWDGRESQGHGGTADIVEYARRQGVPTLIVPVGESWEGPPPGVAGLSPGRSRRPRAVIDSFRRIDLYNRLSLRPRDAENVRLERARLATLLEGSTIRSSYLLVAEWALAHLVRADRLAISNHRRHVALAWAIHLLAAFAVADVAVQTLFFSSDPTWLLGEVLFVLALLLAVGIGRFARFNDRWIGYRSLAEAFRSAMFLAPSGGDDRRDVTGTGVLGEPNEAWFQRAFSQAWRSCPKVSPADADAAALRRFLVEGWLDDQIDYHRQAAGRWRRLHGLSILTMSVLAVVTIVVALLHIAEVGSGWVEDALKLSALTLPAFGGAVAGLREFGQLRLHEERSKRTAVRLQALRDTEVGDTLESVGRLAVDAQQIMVDEALDWYGVAEHQEIDIVI